MALRELALFAGAGGGILGGHLLGWRTVAAVEIEDYPRAVLLQRQADGILPRFPVWDDVCTFNGKPWRGKVDVISGGFPCQDISAAGKGAGISGERSGLWSEFARIIGEYDRDSHSWKTHHCLFPEVLPWSSVTLPKWGMMRNGVCWERMTWEGITSERGSGYWPTPVKDGLNGGSHARKALRKMWPTPTKKNAKECRAPSEEHRNTPSLAWQAGGKLNPDWVEWLMNWPINWTSLTKGITDDHIKCWTEASTEALQGSGELRNLWWTQDPSQTSSRSRYNEQYPGEYPSAMCRVPRKDAFTGKMGGPQEGKTMRILSPHIHIQEGETESLQQDVRKPFWMGKAQTVPRVGGANHNRVVRLEAIGNGQVPIVAATAFTILRSRIEKHKQSAK